MGSWAKRVIVALGAIALFAVLLATWLAGTASGTRWLAARSAAYLPAALSFEGLEGSLLGGLTIADLRWRDASAEVTVAELFVSLRLPPLFSRHVDIEVLRANEIRVRLQSDRPPASSDSPLAIDLPLRISVESARLTDIEYVDGALEQRIDRVSLAGAMQGSLLELSSVEVLQAASRLLANLSAQLRPPYTTELTADWNLEDLATTPLAGRLQVSGDADVLSVQHDLTAPAAVHSEATLSVSGGTPALVAVSEWSELPLTLAADRRLLTREGRIAVSGWTDSFAIDGSVSASVDDWPTANIEFSGTATLESFAVDMLRARSEVGQLLASGTVNWRDGVRWDSSVEFADIRPAAVTAALSGSIDVSGATSGWWRDGELRSAAVTVESIAGTLNDQPVNGDLAAQLEGDLLTIDSAALKLQDNELAGSGTLVVSEQRINARVEWLAPTLAMLHPSAGGSSEGQLTVRGALDNWVAEASLNGSDLLWNQLAVASLAVDGNLRSDEFGELTLRAGELALGDRKFDTLAMVVDGGLVEHNVNVEAHAYGLGVVLDAQGGYADRAWRGRVEDLTATGDALGQWALDSPATLAISQDEVMLGRLCLSDRERRGTACAALRTTTGNTLSADASVSGLPITALPLPVPVGVTVEGRVEATLTAASENGVVNGQLDVQLAEAGASGRYDGETLKLTAREARWSARIEDNRLASTGILLLNDGQGQMEVDIDLENILVADTPLAANAEIAVNDLSFVPLFLPAVSAAAGQLNGTLRLAGSVAQPVYRGSVDLGDGAFRVPAAGIGISEMNVRISQSQPGRLQLRGIARSGEGRVSVTGFTQFAGGEDPRAELSINGENFEVVRLPNWQASASPSVLVQIDRERTRVSGQIAIPSANINLESLPDAADTPSEDAFVHGRDDAEAEAGRITSIDLQAKLGDDVRLDGFGLTTGLTGSVRLLGASNSNLAGLGRLDLVDGRYKAYGQELDIAQGALVFNGPLENPVLDVRAVRRIDDVLAGISLAGTPRTPQSTLYSEPDLSDAEILSYLITGRPLGAASAGEGELLGQAAFALGLTGAGAIATQIGSTLGLDTLAVDGNGGSGRIVAGKRLGDRLLVEYGYGLVDKLGTLLLRYELNEKVVIESSTGSVSALDVVYSIKRN